jgi:hypothetical protein
LGKIENAAAPFYLLGFLEKHIPAKTSKMVFIVNYIERTHNGNEHSFRKVFETLELASDWLQLYIQSYCEDYNIPEDWDTADMGNAPPPNKIMFSVPRLRELMVKEAAKPKGQRQGQLRVYGPESEFGMNRPLEILIEEVAMNA